MKSKVHPRHTESAIIGFWRMGAKSYEISSILEVHNRYVESTIFEYRAKLIKK